MHGFFESSNWRACSVFNFSAVIVCFYEKVCGTKFGRALPKFEAILILSLPWLIFFLAFAFPWFVPLTYRFSSPVWLVVPSELLDRLWWYCEEVVFWFNMLLRTPLSPLRLTAAPAPFSSFYGCWERLRMLLLRFRLSCPPAFTAGFYFIFTV